jgi:GAF domain-containing protein
MWEAVAGQCALALDRALLFEAEKRANETLAFLAEGTALMISALDPDLVVHRLVQLAVPRLADSCAVFIARDGYLVRQAIAIRADEVVTTRFVDAGRIPVEADLPVCAAFRTGRPHIVEDPIGTLVQAGLSPPLTAALQASGVRRGVAVPLHAGGETVGSMVVAWADERGNTTHDRYALDGLAARAAIALTNAGRFRRQLEIADTLAAAVLPAELPVPAGIDLAARYIPATGAVAGDWFEALPRKNGELVIGVGDAAGHGLPAVAVMSELRSAARGLAVAGMTPAGILEHLSILLATTKPPDVIATAFYATVDPMTGCGLWSSAGHPPPLLVPAHGTPRYLAAPPNLPLGVADPPRYTDRALELAADSAIVLLTDGVVERRRESLDASLDLLATVVSDLGTRDANAIADRLVERFCADPDDDCCILVVHQLGDAGHGASR